MANEKIIFDTEVKVGNSVGSVKSLKAELRAVTNELGTLEAGSEAFVKAAQKAGELQDRIGDVKNTVAAFNPEAKFQALAGAVGIAANGFSAMQGAMALMGSESEDLNRIIAQTQGAIALATGLNGLLGMKDAFNLLKLQAVTSFTAIKAAAVTTFTTIKGAMAATGIGALVVALGYLYTKFLETSAANEEATKKEKEYAEQTKKTKEATDEKVKSIELEIIAIKNKTNAAGATLLQAKAEKLALEEQIKIAEEHNKKQKEAYTTVEVGNKIVTISNLAETDSLKKKLVEKNKEIESLDLIAKKTNELEAIKKSAEDAEKQAEQDKAKREKAATDAKKKKEDEAKEDFEFYSNLSKDQYKKQAEIDKDAQILKNVEQDKIASDIDAANKKQEEDDKKALIKHNETLKETSTNERLSYDDRLAAYKQMAAENLITAKELKDAEISIEKEKQAAKMLELDAYANILSQASGLLGKTTVEGKALAIAQATISTYTAISKTLAAFSGVPIPGYTIVQAIATGVAGFAAVKNIIDTPVPNNGGGGGGGGGITAPSAPRIPQSFSGTKLGGNSEVITRNNGQVQKVIVTETDITKTQNNVKNIVSKATIK
jgi:hypothetical protein